MTRLIPHATIGRVVGARRHPTLHVGRIVSAEQKAYILHPDDCVKLHGADLRRCPLTLAVDDQIRVEQWLEDRPVTVATAVVA